MAGKKHKKSKTGDDAVCEEHVQSDKTSKRKRQRDSQDVIPSSPDQVDAQNSEHAKRKKKKKKKQEENGDEDHTVDACVEKEEDRGDGYQVVETGENVISIKSKHKKKKRKSKDTDNTEAISVTTTTHEMTISTTESEKKKKKRNRNSLTQPCSEEELNKGPANEKTRKCVTTEKDIDTEKIDLKVKRKEKKRKKASDFQDIQEDKDIKQKKKQKEAKKEEGNEDVEMTCHEIVGNGSSDLGKDEKKNRKKYSPVSNVCDIAPENAALNVKKKKKKKGKNEKEETAEEEVPKKQQKKDKIQTEENAEQEVPRKKRDKEKMRKEENAEEVTKKKKKKEKIRKDEKGKQDTELNHEFEKGNVENVTRQNNSETGDGTHNLDSETNTNIESVTKPAALGQWETAGFTSTDRQQKFLRLLGGFKSSSKSDNGNASGPKKKGLYGSLCAGTALPSGKFAMSQSQQEELNNKLTKQYDDALCMRLDPHKGGGLGYQKPPEEGKTFYINKGLSTSVKLD